jgi:hypothetical protein
VIRLSGALPLERAGIPLHDAPERYSDQEKWGEIVRIVGNRDAALAFVSRYTSGDFFSLSPLASAIRREFIERLVNGSLVATGCFPNSVEVVTIPGSRCLGLRPEFVTDRLIGNNRMFVDVRVLDPAQLVSPSASRTDECILWMRQRRAEDETRKKALEREALRLWPDLTTREFGAAFKVVFARQRGRPQKIGH